MYTWYTYWRNSLHCLPKSLMSSAMLSKVSRIQRPSKETLVKSYLFISEPDTATFYPALFTAQSPMVVGFLYCQKTWLISRVKLTVLPFSCFRSIPWLNLNWNAKNGSFVKWLLILHKWSTRRKIDQLIMLGCALCQLICFLFQLFFTINSSFLRTSFIDKSLRMEALPHGYLQGLVRDNYNAIFLTIQLNRNRSVNLTYPL